MTFDLQLLAPLSAKERHRRYRVEAVESVTVPAGTFQVFHVTMKDPTGRLLGEYWYSPDAKWIIKDRTYRPPEIGAPSATPDRALLH